MSVEHEAGLELARQLLRAEDECERLKAELLKELESTAQQLERAERAEAALVSAQEEIARLKDWKESAVTSMTDQRELRARLREQIAEHGGECGNCDWGPDCEDCGLLREALAALEPPKCVHCHAETERAEQSAQEAAAREQPEDFAWAIDRVTRMCASALVDAQVYRQKLLKGFGYPNETFRAAQDYRALSIVLSALSPSPMQENRR